MSSNLEEKKEYTFTWKIENFGMCARKKGEFFESPVFRAKNLYDTSWCIRLYPRGHAISEEGYIGCCLNRNNIDNGGFECDCEFEISIMSPEGKILASNKTSHIFRKNQDRGWSDFCINSIQSIDMNDILIVRCNLKSNVLKSPSRSESSGVTSFDYDQCSFKWIINNLNSNGSEVIKFPRARTPQVEISVQVPDDDVKITIRRDEEVTEAKSVMCRITLLDVKGGKQESKRALHLFETKDASIEKDSWEFPTFLKKSKLNSEKEKYLKNDCLALNCEMAISNGTQTESVEDNECDSSAVELSIPNTGIVSVLEDYKRLYSDKTHADVKLIVDGQTIRAHKCILCIRSPVFSAMFNADMIENETRSVNIPDFEAEIVNSLLEYMYTGTVEKLNYESAMKLIVAADKYGVLSLKEMCAHFLKSVLSLANVCAVLVVADLIQDEVLKVATVEYIKDNSESILKSEEWTGLVEKNLKLATDTFCKVSNFTAANCKNLGKK